MMATNRRLAVLAAICLGLAAGLLPSVGRALNDAGCQLVQAGQFKPAVLIFWYLKALGNADAINNYAVLQKFGLGVSQNNTVARQSFTRARRRGSAAAEYNYALSPVGASNAEIRKQRFALLERGAAAGDAHSAAALGVELRSGLTDEDEEREDRVIQLLTTAAASRDIDYQLLLVDEYWRQASNSRDSARFVRGADIVRELAKVGEPRAALFLSRHASAIERFSDDAGDLLSEPGAQGWLERAAATGYLPARCQLGVGRFKNVTNRLPGATIENLRQSVGDLLACARDTRKVPEFTPRIFGSPGLYADKAVIDYESPIYYARAANRALAKMYADGLGVTADAASSAKYAAW